ncbi:MAG TPA: AAA family ATPase [Anaerolineales bacterium]|nr:AAA family ATPase [Anaerolineales bacterium]
MTKVIALAGKGGTGKTTIAALITQNLVQRSLGPVLAIDADPSTNLHMALGLATPETIGEVREDMMETAQGGQLGVSISRHDYLSHEIRMVMEEGEQIDLLAMGRPEGQGCYCAVNHLLRNIIDDIGGKYPFVVIDNEAGMEHISRRTTKDVDQLIVVTDPTIRGIRAAASIAAMATDVEVNVRQTSLIVNRVIGSLPSALQTAVDELGIEVLGMVPADDRVGELDAIGQPLIALNGDSPAASAVAAMTKRILDNLA